MAAKIKNSAVQKPTTPLELVGMLIQCALLIPGGLKPDVSHNLQRAYAALVKKTGIDLSAARQAAAAALAACMVNHILDDRPETGLVYTVANLLTTEQIGRA